MRGELQEGDLLPSIRSLAKDLRISVITTRRAYEELEREGFITSSVGRGSYVARKNVEMLREIQLREIETLLTRVLDLASACDLDLSDLTQMLQLLSKGDPGHEQQTTEFD